jgi:hypothetical protein
MTKMTTHYYAAQSPRGFANEISVHIFCTRADRDQWVAKHADDGDVNAAYCGAYAITSRRARKIIGYRGDAVTENFNSHVSHS